MKALLILLGTILGMAGASMAAPVPACPARPARLTAVTVFSGPPSEQADLRPDASGHRRGVDYESFGSLDLNAGRGTWLACHYGAATIERRLVAVAKRCTAFYARRRDGAGRLLAFTCTDRTQSR